MIISFEGNIGAGKTTLMRKLEQEYGIRDPGVNVIFVPEPIEVWDSPIVLSNELRTMLPEEMRDSEKTPLQYMYEGIQKRDRGACITFQIIAFATRAAALNRAIENAPHGRQFIIVTERGLLTDKMIFTKELASMGLINSHELFAYQTIWQMHVDRWNKFYKGVIMVETDAEECQKRLKGRARKGECAVSLEYLKSLEERHKGFLEDIQTEKSTIVINNSEPGEGQEGEIIGKIVTQIRHWIQWPMKYWSQRMGCEY